jgi:type VI secretion system protein ImpE
MSPEDHLRAGDPVAALGALQEKVRANPADPRLRIFLFQLLCVLGDWKRAITQLKVCGEMSPAALPMAQTYREAIICEVYRAKVFSGEKEPLIFGQPQNWVALLVQALKDEAAGRAAEAALLRARAFDEAPAAGGELNGQKFSWVADADMRLGPVFEAVVNGRYFWVPFASIAAIEIEEPADLRDSVWTPCALTLANGGQVVALIPTRYAGTAETGTAGEKLARATSWTEGPGGAYFGRGQRIWATDGGDVPLMDVRSLKMDVAAAGGAASDG